MSRRKVDIHVKKHTGGKHFTGSGRKHKRREPGTPLRIPNGLIVESKGQGCTPGRQIHAKHTLKTWKPHTTVLNSTVPSVCLKKHPGPYCACVHSVVSGADHRAADHQVFL